MSENSSKSRLKMFLKPGLFLSAIFLTLVAEEVVLRIYNFRSKGDSVQLLGQDPALGWRFKPNLKSKMVTEGRESSVTFNSAGFRGDEPSQDKAPGTFRLLMLGDSFLAGLQVSEPQLVSERLEQRLALERKRPIEVINCGVSGYDTGQEFLLYHSIDVARTADEVILLFYDNDIWFNKQNSFFGQMKPSFEIRDGQLQSIGISDPKKDLQALGDPKLTRSISWGQAIKEWLAAHSHLYLWLRERIRASALLYRWAADLGLSGKDNQVPDDFRVWSVSPDPDIQEAWEVTGQLLLEIKKEADRHGSRFLVFYVPSRAAIYDEEWHATCIRYGLSRSVYNPCQVAKDLARFCRKHQLDFVDPTEMIKRKALEMRRQGHRLYFAVDLHWTAEGHDVAAEILAKEIKWGA